MVIAVNCNQNSLTDKINKSNKRYEISCAGILWLATVKPVIINHKLLIQKYITLVIPLFF